MHFTVPDRMSAICVEKKYSPGGIVSQTLNVVPVVLRFITLMKITITTAQRT